MKKYHLTLIATALLASTLGQAQEESYTSEIAEAPPTTRMKVENIQTRHDKAIADLQALFDRIAKNPALISSKEAVDAIDQGDRALKNTRTAIASIIATLKSETKTITAESSFTDDQKTELLAAAEAMIAKCDDLTTKTTVAITHLEGAYKAMPKWRKIHRTYLNLDGEANASKHLEASVKEFVDGLTAEPEAAEEEANVAENDESADEQPAE